MSASGGAFAVGFRELERWDVTFFRGVSWQWPAEYIMPLGVVALRKRIEVKDSQDLASIPIIEKISFGGMISITEPEDREGYKGRLFWAETGDLIYSKIRVKQGSLAVVPTGIKRIAVSAEYPVYTIRTGQAIPDYIELVLRTRSFLQLLDDLAHGGSTKTRIPPEDFERLDIPVPPLETQRAIVARWRAAQAKIDAAKWSLRQIIDDLNSRLYEIYHRECAQDVLGKRWMAVKWAALPRWDAKTARASAFRTASLTFVPLGQFAEEATETVRPWEQPEKDWPVYGVNNKDGVFFSYYQRGEEFNAPYKRIRKDWFFHNPTRSSVGSLGMVPEVPDDAITSPEYQVWRIKQGLHPGYVAVLINTPFFISLIQFHRVGAVKQRLYVENLLEIPIPVIPFDEQASIAQARGLALESVAEAARIRTAAAAEVEAMILGTTEAPDLRPTAWEAERGHLAQLSGQGPVPGGRTWKREDLYEETRDAEAS